MEVNMDDQIVETQDEENEENVAPQQDAQEPETEEPEEQPEKVEEPEQKEEEQEQSADYYADFLNQTTPGVLPELKFDDDGSIPADTLQNWGKSVIDNARNEAARQFSAMREEDRQWQQAFKKYPELNENKKLRDLVHKQRIGNVLGGGKNDIMSAAKELFALREDGHKTGAQSAKESIVRQKSADLETASTPSNTGASESKKLLELSASRNKKVADEARRQLLKQMIESGQL